MTLDPRKRQKKLERQKAKQKEKHREITRRESRGLPARLAEAASAPILHCLVAQETWDEGIGQVLISRQLRNGNVAFVVFLVDMFCLGVKNVIMQIAPVSRYNADVYDKMLRHGPYVELKPPCIRKLVEGAVQYAADLGLSPHEDYRTARLIFGDIDAGACTEEYEYGKDGKPFFIAGPYDDEARCNAVYRALENRLGPDAFHFLMPVQDLRDE